MKSKAFTLMEMTIVLFLTALLLLIGFKISQKSQNQFIEEQFIQNLTTKINEKLTYGRNHQKYIKLVFLDDKVVMYDGTTHVEKYQYPKTLTVHGVRTEMLSATGVTRPQTIQFVNHKEKYGYDLIFELSFGGTYRVRKNIYR